jgi:transcriptional regulator with XRE-family HTH domain
MNNDMAVIGERIKRLRADRELSQADVAARLDLADDTVVSKIEAGTRGLAVTELTQLCELFGLRSDQILFGTAEEAPVGAMLRVTESADAQRVVKRVEEAFNDYLYVRALVES